MIITRLFSLQQLYCTPGVFFSRLIYDGCCAAVIAYKSNHSPSRNVALCTGAQIFSRNIIRSADNVFCFVFFFVWRRTISHRQPGRFRHRSGEITLG
jgi:hypothetical protein